MTDKTDLGDRMKFYESMETDRRLLPGLPVYARIDGRKFSRFTKGLTRPFDKELHELMITVTKGLVEETHALIGYTQSDEISLAWYPRDFKSEIFFNGRVFKMLSALAATATSLFTLEGLQTTLASRITNRRPTFDARVCCLPNLDELANMFLWREQDATKNAISMAARAVYSHKSLHGQNGKAMQEMLFAKGVNFNDYPPEFKRGSFVRKIVVERNLTNEELEKIPPKHRPTGPVKRSKLVRIDMPSFGKVVNRVDVISGEEPVVTHD